MALLEVQDLSKRFGGFVALDGIELAAPASRRWSTASAGR
jgi:ABC-type branched-subunit amino acid transport system ATPase component